MENTKAKSDQSFRIEDLLNGKISRDQFQIDYLPMFKMLDDTDRKLASKGGLSGMKTEEIWKRIYDYGIITVSLNKADMQTRIDDLNEQNLKWFTKADTLETENNFLKAQLDARNSGTKTEFADPVKVVEGVDLNYDLLQTFGYLIYLVNRDEVFPSEHVIAIHQRYMDLYGNQKPKELSLQGTSSEGIEVSAETNQETETNPQ